MDLTQFMRRASFTVAEVRTSERILYRLLTTAMWSIRLIEAY